VTHGENLRVLIFGENASEVESLATLLRASAHTLQTDYTREAGDPAPLWQYGVDFMQGNLLQEPGRQPGYDFAGGIA
jgi:hypothetical protein